MSQHQSNPSVSTYVPLLDGTNYREWSAQMRAYLRSVGYWLIVNGTTMAPTDPAELAKWTLSDSMANGAIELRTSINIRDQVAATSAATWTALSTAFGRTLLCPAYSALVRADSVVLRTDSQISNLADITLQKWLRVRARPCGLWPVCAHKHGLCPMSTSKYYLLVLVQTFVRASPC